MIESIQKDLYHEEKIFKQPVLLFSILTTLFMAFTELPIWMMVFSTVLIFWRFAAEEFSFPRLKTIGAATLGVLVFIMTYIQFRTIWGQTESATILVGLISIFILTYKTRRDHRLLILLGFMLVAMKPMFALDLIWAVPSLIAMIGLWSSLLSNSVQNKSKYLFLVIAYSVPAIGLLFVFFPRVVLFQTSRYNKDISSTGFSEELSPGRIAGLVQSKEPAFYVKFDRDIILSNSLLRNEDLYWRGSVLADGEGFDWKKLNVAIRQQKSEKASPKSNDSRSKIFNQKFNYSLILEPNDHRVIFSLDVPSRVKQNSISIDKSNDNTYRIGIPLLNRTQFDFMADPDFKSEADTTSLKNYLDVGKLQPKVSQWITLQKEKHKTQIERLKAIEKFFSASNFRYTLNPGTYGKYDLDEFLFNRKKGFCEHYAAAYATLARALGIPARLVIGYQGGEYNTIGNFWKVSQRDAHAWVEIAVDNEWKRVDPTSWVAPLRMNIPAEQFFSLPESEQILFSRDKNLSQSSFDQNWNSLIHFIDTINYSWTLFLLEYDKEKQLDLIKSFMEKLNLKRLVMVIVLLFIVLTSLFTIRKLISKKSRRQILSNELAKLEKKLIAKGQPIGSSDTAQESIDLARLHLPELALENFQMQYDEEFFVKEFKKPLNFFEQIKLERTISFIKPKKAPL